MVTLLFPLVLLGLVELALRVTVRSPGYPLFVPAPFAPESHLLANREVATRWFTGLTDPPAPKPQPFAAVKPGQAFRVFVLGESSTAGFPYRGNVTFAALLGEALRTALPRDSVEVVNLGMAAINSYAIWDIARDLPAQHPDAVLIYAGHNEYYGALGVGSQQRAVLSQPPLVRAYLRLLRLRTAWAIRAAIARLGRRSGAAAAEREAPGLMELLAREQQIQVGGPVYSAGARQFESNLEAIVGYLARRGIPVFLASVASNLADQPPFAAGANSAPGGAAEVYAAARRLQGEGDSDAARTMFERARDADVVRFRAPTAFNGAIERVARRNGVRYVPVAEAFDAEAAGGIPGADLFLEHVHPNRHGHMIIARTFYDVLLESGALNRAGSNTTVDWRALEAEAPFTALDERVVLHSIRTITTRWPFVPWEAARDYRGEYRPQGLIDSLAFAVSRGLPWQRAKLELAAHYERRGLHDSAAAEYRTLVDDAPLLAEPLVLLARAAAAQRAYPEAVAWLSRAARLAPGDPDVAYQLSLAHALAGNVAEARGEAVRLARLAPQYPGLGEWLSALGLRR